MLRARFVETWSSFCASSAATAITKDDSRYTECVIRLFVVFMLLLPHGDRPASLESDLVFLTRDGCVNTPDMVNNLDDALAALKRPKDYAYINIDTLPKTDVRTGYPTPTILWKGRDIFGMPIPKPPLNAPS